MRASLLPFAMLKTAIGLTVLMAATVAAPCRAASLLFDPTVDSCTTINCGSITVGGTVPNSAGLSTARWDVAIYANVNECLRLDEVFMSGTDADDEMVVVAPDGEIYRSDDSGGTLRPSLVIRPTLVSGWYYVSIARFNGAPAPEHNILFAFGRYVDSDANPNCTSPTNGAETAIFADSFEDYSPFP